MTRNDLEQHKAFIDYELRELARKAEVLAKQKASLESERDRLQVIQQTACDHPVEERDMVMVNNEPEYFCSLCGKDF